MLIKACSLKLIRCCPGSFIKIDILATATPDEPIQDTGRNGRVEPEKDGERKGLQVHLPSSSIVVY